MVATENGSPDSIIKPCKYAGAGWLDMALPQERPISDFGVKVANVLGQAYLGIYHIRSAVLSKKVDWGDLGVISVTVGGELATYDGSVLTYLVLCCQAAGIGVDICGSFQHYTKLVFSDNRPSIGAVLGVSNESCLAPGSEHPRGDFLAFAERFAYVRKPIEKATGGGRTYSVKPIRWHSLQIMINECHKYAIRGALVGRSPNTLEAMFTQRSTAGEIYDRHPNITQTRNHLEPLTGIDYQDRGL